LRSPKLGLFVGRRTLDRDITAYIRDENLITLDWLYSNAVGGVKVDVSDEDYEPALQILESEG
jgi:hypothetical protein